MDYFITSNSQQVRANIRRDATRSAVIAVFLVRNCRLVDTMKRVKERLMGPYKLYAYIS